MAVTNTPVSFFLGSLNPSVADRPLRGIGFMYIKHAPFLRRKVFSLKEPYTGTEGSLESGL